MIVKNIKLLMLVVLGCIVAACAENSSTETAEATTDSELTAGADSGGAIDSSAIDGQSAEGSSEVPSELQALLEQTTIYFEVDESTIDPGAEEIIAAHAEYLNARKSAQVLLEGHADERGTREYNLALGDRRAESVNMLMQALGIDGSRITAISHGEEVPAVEGNDENSWSLNRRVEIIY